MRYNNPRTPAEQVSDFFLRGGIPVTLTLLTISVALFLASFFTSGRIEPFLQDYVAFMPGNLLHAPWTLLTYPVYAGGSFLGLLIGGFFLWLAGGSLERSWGSARYGVFFFALTLISAVSLLLGYYIYSHSVLPLFGFGLPLSGMIVAFCMLNRELTLRFFLFPIRAIYVAWIITALTYFSAGMGPILNLFACGSIIAAFFYVRFGRSWGNIGSYSARPRKTSRGPDLRVYPAASRRGRASLDGSPLGRSLFDFAGRWKDWQERRRLERLLKNSGYSPHEPEWRDEDGRSRR